MSPIDPTTQPTLSSWTASIAPTPSNLVSVSPWMTSSGLKVEDVSMMLVWSTFADIGTAALAGASTAITGYPSIPVTTGENSNYHFVSNTTRPATPPQTTTVPATGGGLPGSGGVGGTGTDCDDENFYEAITPTALPISDLPKPAALNPTMYAYNDYMGSPPDNTGLA